MISDNKPIGVFDSGIGGLTVLNALKENFGAENYVYFGDNENAPYGGKSVAELGALSARSVKRLLKAGVKLIVTACVTLSTTCAEKISEAAEGVPVIFTYPRTDIKNAVLICTPRTALSGFVRENFKNDRVVPLPFLAGEIERNVLFPEKINVKCDVLAIGNAENVVLGCTHYGFVKEKLEKLTGANIYEPFSNVLDGGVKYGLKAGFGGTVSFKGRSATYNEKVYKIYFDKSAGEKAVAGNDEWNP